MFKASIDKVFESKFRALVILANVIVEAEAAVRLSAPLEFIVTTPVPCPKFVVPVEESVVKAPVPAVVAPIAVELIPVEVVLKLDEVKVSPFAPVEIDEADKPDKVRVPEVAVKFKAPVDSVKPFEAVSSPVEVIEVLAVKVVNVPAPAVPPPIAPGLAKVAPAKAEALIVPVPPKFSEAPDPTTIAAVVLVPEAMVENAGEPPELSVAQSQVLVPAAHFKI